MVINDTLVRRKASLDQLRKGLVILGILGILEKNGDSMAQYFIHNDVVVKPSELINKLNFVGVSDEKQKLLIDIIKSYDEKMIEKFLLFVSCMTNMFSFYTDQKIQVKFNEAEAIFASTCEFAITISTSIDNKELLKAALDVVVDNNWSSFNTY